MIKNVGVRIWLMWLDNIFSYYRRKNNAPRKFVILSPPFLKVQKIKNIETASISKVKIRNNVDLRTLYDIFHKEEYSAKHFADRLRSIDSNYLIIDLGANIGCASLFFLFTFRMASVIALEPDNDNFSILCDNLRNFTSRVKLLNAGVGPREAFCDNMNSDNVSGQFDAFRFEESDSGKIRMCSMAGLVKEFANNNHRIILKIDIEGYEKHIFDGDTSWFESVDMVFIEGHDWMISRGSTLSGFLSHISNNNFDVFVSGENIISVRHSCYG